jgi:hypothetical protein
MKIELTRAIHLAGELVKIGSVIDAPISLAAELIGSGKAIAAVEAEEKPKRKKADAE